MRKSRRSPTIWVNPSMGSLSRRRFVTGLGLASFSALGINGCATAKAQGRKRVVVVGGGFAGATCAKYLRKLEPALHVTLIAATEKYVTCPFSNLVIAGLRSLGDLTFGYRAMAAVHGVDVVHDRVSRIDAGRRNVVTESGKVFPYERLVIAPGVAFNRESPQGYDTAASYRMPHAWNGGEQSERLHRQLVAMRNGGTVAIAVPAKPFKCPPGPYERASLIAYYLKRHKPKSKILILDANESYSKQPLFEEAWQALYPGMIEHIPISEDGAVVRVNPATMTLYTELERHRVDVANVIPAQRAGELAATAGLTDGSGWCPVDHRTFESTLTPHVHVLGDAALAGAMPKSASAANSQAKACALAITAYLRGDPAPEPSLHNTCYSLVDPRYGISVSAIYRLDQGKITEVEGSGGTSPIAAAGGFRAREADYTLGWYRSITADTFG